MPRDAFDFMTAQTAAAHCGVSQACIRQWVRRGQLTPVPGRGPRRQMLFRVSDVLEAERLTADRSRRAA